jgi:site-specific DNA-methyltransferase (adenine-specific)
MDEVDDESVHLVVTSPPYWQIKNYEHEKQIGYNQSYDEYIRDLELVWENCFKKLAAGCRMCINVGDQYTKVFNAGIYKAIPIHASIIVSCEKIGFYYMGAIIWKKISKCTPSGGVHGLMGSYPYPRSGIVKYDYEFILIFRKPGGSPRVDGKIKEESILSRQEWVEYFCGGLWDFPGARQKEHIAVFPEELPYRLIRMFSFVGDTVLDPFLGSGTTTAVARRLRRNSIGYELNPDYLPIIREKVAVSSLDLFGHNDTVEIVLRDAQGKEGKKGKAGKGRN